MEPPDVNPDGHPGGEVCATCRFWHRDRSTDERAGWGQCRRMPPAAPPIEIDRLVHVGVWPSTRRDDWCGEWQAVEV